jgi:hypothetical protein
MKYEKALIYFFYKCKKEVKSGKIRGLKLKSLMDFIRIIENFQKEIDLGHLTDYEEVINYDN